MADPDNDPTMATPVGHTQPMTPAPDAAKPARASGWRSGQVAVVAVLALLLGAAGATLAWLAADSDDQEPTDAAATPTTSTTSDDADPSASSSSTTSSVSTTTTTRSSSRSGGQTVVGNGIFTGSYQGNSDRSTDDFTVGDEWKIRWDVPEGTVTIEVLNASGELVETIQAQGQGERVVDAGGTYRLDIGTDGSRYAVAVTDGP